MMIQRSNGVALRCPADIEESKGRLKVAGQRLIDRWPVESSCAALRGPADIEINVRVPYINYLIY